jgi:hypothetical protein
MFIVRRIRRAGRTRSTQFDFWKLREGSPATCVDRNLQRDLSSRAGSVMSPVKSEVSAQLKCLLFGPTFDFPFEDAISCSSKKFCFAIRNSTAN